MIEIGQLRRWVPARHGDGHAFLNIGEVFLVTGIREMPSTGERFVDYIMSGKTHWDEDDWVEQYSEVISETG
jgi:hypothetical protein